MRSTPKASVTVVTIGNPSGMAATAKDTVQVPWLVIRVGSAYAMICLTSDCKHLEPTSLLKDTNEAYDADNPK